MNMLIGHMCSSTLGGTPLFFSFIHFYAAFAQRWKRWQVFCTVILAINYFTYFNMHDFNSLSTVLCMVPLHHFNTVMLFKVIMTPLVSLAHTCLSYFELFLVRFFSPKMFGVSISTLPDGNTGLFCRVRFYCQKLCLGITI